MKYLLVSISLIGFLLTNTSFAQNLLQVQNRKQLHQNKQQYSLMKTRQGQGTHGFIDENGDGINDNISTGSAIANKKRKQLEKPGNSGLDGKNKALKHRRRKNH